MSKILVTADLHIGNDELYNNDVLNGCNEMSKQKIDTVIIAGDTFNRPKPTPEMYDFFGQCMLAIGAKEYYIITGNHDVSTHHIATNAYNTEFLKLSSVHFIDLEPQSFEIGGKSFLFVPHLALNDFGYYVSEIMDQAQVDFVVTHTDIPGAVHGAEQEIQLGNVGSLAALDYSGIKMIISGHIHKHQRGVFGGIPFVYPGSLARVSHSEEKESKGFLVLDTEEMTSKFVTRKTARKWLTVDVNWNGKLPEITKKGDVIRLQVKATPKYRGNIDRSKIEEKLSKSFEQVKINIEYAQKTTKEAKQVAKGLSFDEYENKWIDLNAKGIKKQVQSKIRKTLNSIETKQKGHKKYKGLTLRSIELTNFQAVKYAKKRFNKNDCIGILGEIDGTLTQSNGSGKTSFVEAIRWILYGETRFSKNASAILDGEKKAVGVVELVTAKSDTITICREQNLKSSNCSVIDGKGILLAKGYEVAEWVANNCGLNLNTFDSVIYIGGDKRHNIVGAKATDRLKALQEPLPLERYTKGSLDIIKKERSLNKVEIDKLSGVIEEYNSTMFSEEEINEMYKTRTELQDMQKESEKELKAAKKEFKKCQDELLVSDKYNNLLDKIDEIDIELDTLKKEIDEHETEIKMIDIVSVKEALKAEESALKKVEGKLEKVKEVGIKYKTLVDQYDSELHGMPVIKDDSNIIKCPVCKQDWDISEQQKYKQQIRDKRHTAAKEQMEARGQYSELSKECTVIKSSIDSLEGHVLNYEGLNAGLKELKSDKKANTAQLNKYKKDLTAFKEKYKIKSNAKIRDYQTIRNDHAILERNVQSCESALTAIRDDIVLNDHKISSHEQSEARLAVTQTSLEKKKKLHDILNVCYEAFSPRGIAQFIVMNILDEINAVIPIIINDFSFWQELQIVLEPDNSKVNSTVAIWASMGNKKRREYEGLSAGEKEVVNFIVRMSFKKVLENLIDINYSFVIIDEALDVLDEYNLQAALRYFKKSNTQSFCISHSDIKDLFNKTIILRNTGGVAEVI